MAFSALPAIAIKKVTLIKCLFTFGPGSIGEYGFNVSSLLGGIFVHCQFCIMYKYVDHINDFILEVNYFYTRRSTCSLCIV